MNQHTLPKKRTKSLIERIDEMSGVKIILLGLVFYILVVLVFSLLEFCIQNNNQFIKETPNIIHHSFDEFLYFNFITILTIGYGDYSPSGLFRVLSIIEAILGLGLFSVLVSVFTIKSLLPRKDTIIFSRHAYYCLKEEKFMVIYLNIANDNLINAETCSYVKTGGNWMVKPAVKAPFITKSVQTFFVDQISLYDLKQNVTDYDCLRIGISGNIGIANYSTSIEYNFSNIYVIESRQPLSQYEGFWEVDHNLGKEEFESFFHYIPENPQKLSDYLKL